MRTSSLAFVVAAAAVLGAATCKTVNTTAPGASAPASGAGQCGGLVPVPAAERVSTGHPLLPPKWAFGVLWGSYYDQTGEYAKSAGVAAPLPLTLQDAAAKI